MTEHIHHNHEHHGHDRPVLDHTVTTHHEESTICAYETVVKLPLEEVRHRMETLLKKVRDFVTDAGGIVGHIKSYLEVRGDGIFLSTTGSTVQSQQIEGKSVQIYFTAIVFACDEDALSSEVEALFTELKKSE